MECRCKIIVLSVNNKKVNIFSLCSKALSALDATSSFIGLTTVDGILIVYKCYFFSFLGIVLIY